MLFCALAAFFTTQLCKSVWPRPITPLAKMLLTALAAAGAAALQWPHSAPKIALYGLAGAGLAVIVHRAARALSAGGDWLIYDILHRPRR